MSINDQFTSEEKFAIGLQHSILSQPCTIISNDKDQTIDLDNTSFQTCLYHCDESISDFNPKGTIIKHDQHEHDHNYVVFTFPGEYTFQIRLTDMYFIKHISGFQIFTFRHPTYTLDQIHQMFALAFNYTFREWITSTREYTWSTLKKSLDDCESFNSLENTKYNQLRDDFTIQYRNEFETRFYNFWYSIVQYSFYQLRLSLDNTSPFYEFIQQIKRFIFDQLSNQIFCTIDNVWSMFKQQ